MNWQAIIQYFGLVGTNCAQVHMVYYITGDEGWSRLISLALISLSWGAYIELAIGGILFRPDSQHIRTFQLQNLLSQVSWPLTDRRAWRPDYWDLNYYTVLGGSIASYVAWNYCLDVFAKTILIQAQF